MLILILITVNNWNPDSAYVGVPASPEVRPQQPQREFCLRRRANEGSVKKVWSWTSTWRYVDSHRFQEIYLIIFLNHLTLRQPGDYWLWGYSGRHLGLWQVEIITQPASIELKLYLWNVTHLTTLLIILLIDLPQCMECIDFTTSPLVVQFLCFLKGTGKKHLTLCLLSIVFFILFVFIRTKIKHVAIYSSSSLTNN